MAEEVVVYRYILMMLSPPFEQRGRWRTRERASVVTPRTERSQQPNVNYVARTSSVFMTGSRGAGSLGFV